MAVFAITTAVPAFKDGLFNEPIVTSVRESRAKRHARKLRDGGNRSVMLFKKSGNNWLPISFKARDQRQFSVTNRNCNTPFIDLHPEQSSGQTVAIKLNKSARKAANA